MILRWLADRNWITTYRVYAAHGPYCWRETLPKRDFLCFTSACRWADDKYRRNITRYPSDNWPFVVSTHRDGPELYRTNES